MPDRSEAKGFPAGPASPDDVVTSPVAWTRAMLRQDFQRNPYLTQRITLVVLRTGRAWHKRPGLAAFLTRRILGVVKVIWLEGILGSEVPNQTVIGPGLRIPHSLRGVMLHPTVRVGANATIYHHTVIGVRDTRGGPQLGDGVVIGAGAKVLGPITVADGTHIGANAVVVKDTEPNSTYVGVPAQRVRGRRDS